MGGEAWIGFRTGGRAVNIKCVLITQLPRGVSGAARHVPTSMWLERWGGSAWELVTAVTEQINQRSSSLCRMDGSFRISQYWLSWGCQQPYAFSLWLVQLLPAFIAVAAPLTWQ